MESASQQQQQTPLRGRRHVRHFGTRELWLGLVLTLLCFSPSTACAADKDDAGDVIVVLKRPPRTEHSEKRLLVREVVRQAFLIAARDGFHVSTRDEVLGESLAAEDVDSFVFDLRIEIPDNGEVSVELQSVPQKGAVRNWKIQFQAVDEQILVKAMELAEGWIAKDFPKLLRESGLTVQEAAGAPVRAVADDSMPLESIAQVARLRQLHAALKANRKSPALLAGLARHYGVLSSLCELNWGPEYKVFRARALLYADMAVRNGRQDANAAWSRALVRAITGLDSLAVAEVQRAQLLTKRGKPPAWASALTAFVKWDEPGLQKCVDSDQPLTALLWLLAREVTGTSLQRMEAYEAALRADPNCLRAALAASYEQALGLRRKFGESQLPLFAMNLPAMLQVLDPDKEHAELEPVDPDQIYAACADRVAALRNETRDRGEPSLQSVATLVENLQFAQAVQLVQTQRDTLGVDTTETISQCETLLPHHRLKGHFRAYQNDLRKSQSAYQEVAPLLMESALSQNVYGWVLGLQGLRIRDQYVLQDFLRSQRDDVVPDLERSLSGSNSREVSQRALKILQRLSPSCPAGEAALIRLDWTAAEARAEEWQRTSNNADVLRELAKRYDWKRQRDAQERCLLRLKEVDPSYQSYELLVDFYGGQHRLKDWLAALEESIKLPSQGLERGSASMKLAQWHMSQEKWDVALPYAQTAAQTYSAWGLQCAADCYEGMGNWAESEALRAASAQRYSGDWLSWYLWCRRTGKGDLAAARSLAVDAVDRSEDPQSSLDMERAVYFELERQPERALQIYLNRYVKSKYDQRAAMRAVLVLDELKRFEERDDLIRKVCGSRNGESELMLLCDQLRREQKSSAPGLTPAELELTAAFDFGHGELTDTAYYIGRILRQRGRQQEAEKWLRRAAASPYRNLHSCTLAAVELNAMGVPPEPMGGTEVAEAHRTALDLLRKSEKVEREQLWDKFEETSLTVPTKSPDWPIVWFAAAEASVRTRHLETALESMGRLLELVPGQPLMLCYRGKIREALFDDQGAVRDYEAALASSPSFRMAHNNLGWLRSGSLDASVRNGALALKHARKAIEASPEEDLDGLDLLAAAYAEHGDFTEAVRTAEAIIAKGQYSQMSSLKRRLVLYQQQQPHRRRAKQARPVNYYSYD